MPFKLKNEEIKKVVGKRKLKKGEKMAPRKGPRDHMKSASEIREQGGRKLIKSPMKGKLKPCQKAAAKRKFKVYPSAYANMWASRHKC